MKNVALITGASSGIGMELARIHASKGGDLVIVARRRERLDELKAELEGKYGITVAVIDMDLSEPGVSVELFREITERGIEVEYLVNNAGFGRYGVFHETELESDRDMVRLNVVTLTELARLFLTGMVERNRGRVLNVASMSGFVPGPFQAVYYATKAYVVSLSESVAEELRGTGVTMTVLCPNATRTEFAEVSHSEDSPVFRMGAASARSVADYGYRAMMRGKRVAIPGITNRLLIHFGVRLMPRRALAWISRKMIEKR